MNKKIFTVFTVILLIFVQTFYAQEEKQYTSLWEGTLKISSVSLRIVLKVFKNDNGSLGAFMDSPDQGAKDIPVSSVTFTDDSLKFEIKMIAGKYEGVMIKDSALVKGKWSQATLSLPLDLKKVEKLVEIKRPQTPQKPYPYNEEEVTFDNKEANIKLAGTFTFPKEGKNFPVVVLISGSGPQDRDETLLNHKPFLVIADYLTRNGIAVLRYDDRGFGKSEGNFAAATSLDFATDASAAVDFLKTRKEVDQKKIGVAGHSEGGLIAPMVANNNSDVDYIILLAGPGVTGAEILLLQGDLISKAEGADENEIKKSYDLRKKVFDTILSESDSTKAVEKLNALYDEYFNTLKDEEKKNPNNSREAMQMQLRQIMSPWFRFFLKYDPRPSLENLTVPVLALNGEKDLQVPPKQNLPEIEKALKSGGNTKHKIVELPSLNHLFQTAKTGAFSEYAKNEETFSPDALKIIKDWILEVTK